jgi:hypothetical protein
MQQQRACTAFHGARRIASGPLSEVALRAKAVLDQDETASILIFDNATAHPIDVDFRGTPGDMVRRLEKVASAPVKQAAAKPRCGPGRPKLGVVAREVTLLPRHWDWLKMQPGGASVALRNLVEEAKRGKGDNMRQSQEAAYRFMSAMAGNEAGFEEAARALFAGNQDRFAAETEAWPRDVRDHAQDLASRAFQNQNETAA